MAVNKDSVVSAAVSAKSYPKTSFDTILLLTDLADFAEDFRVYQDLSSFSVDNVDATLVSAVTALFSQEPKAVTVIIAKTTASADIGALAVDIVTLDVTLDIDYFGVCVVSSTHTDAQLIELAKYIETKDLLLALYTKDANAITTATTDLAYLVKALNLRNTSVWYNATQRVDIAFLSRFLGEKIGLVSAKHLLLSGVTISALTSTELTNVLGKNANVFARERKKYDFTKQGVTSTDENIESVAGEMFVKITCTESIYEILLNNSRISFNPQDIRKVKSAIDFTLQRAVNQKIIAEYDAVTGAGYILSLEEFRADSRLEVDIKYLDAGTLKWVDLKLSVFKDDEQFNIERIA